MCVRPRLLKYFVLFFFCFSFDAVGQWLLWKKIFCQKPKTKSRSAIIVPKTNTTYVYLYTSRFVTQLFIFTEKKKNISTREIEKQTQNKISKSQCSFAWIIYAIIRAKRYIPVKLLIISRAHTHGNLNTHVHHIRAYI